MLRSLLVLFATIALAGAFPAFADSYPMNTGDLLVQCEAEGLVLDVRSVDGSLQASLNYKETPNAITHVGSVVPVEKMDGGVKQSGKSYWKKSSYCAEPTLPVRKFELKVNGSVGTVTMKLGYDTAPILTTLSCWGILTNSSSINHR